MPTTRQVLKSYFEAGKEPTEQQFAEFIDSFYHLTEDTIGGAGGEFANIGEAQAGTNATKYMNPLLVKAAIQALTTLANCQILQGDIQTLIDLNIDDIESAIATASSSVSLDDDQILATAKAVHDLNTLKEDAFSKNTAFNKDFGFDTGKVLQGDLIIAEGYMILFSNGSMTAAALRGTHLNSLWAYSNPLAGNTRQVVVLHSFGANNYVPIVSASSNNSLEKVPCQVQRHQANTFEFTIDPSLGTNNIRIQFKLLKN